MCIFTIYAQSLKYNYHIKSLHQCQIVIGPISQPLLFVPAMWYCYILASTQYGIGGVASGSATHRTYTGCTVNIKRRIRQHNRINNIRGGAKSTRGRVWKLVALLRGLPDKTSALQLEHAIKKHKNKRIEALARMFTSKRACKKCNIIGNGLENTCQHKWDWRLTRLCVNSAYRTPKMPSNGIKYVD